MKLNKNILILKKCATFRSIRTNIHKIDFIYRYFSNIKYQSLIFRQRDTTRLFLNSIRDCRANVHSPPTAHDVQLQAPNQSIYYNRQYIIRDCFMNSSNFFSGDGFATGP